MDSAGQWDVHLMTIGDTIIHNQTSYYSSDDGPTTGPSLVTTIAAAMHYSLIETVMISIALLAIIIGTVVGNVLVCIAVCLVRRLRRPCNYLLVSLAVSDLCVALLVMPMALVYEVLGTWPFGAKACDTWVAFDVLSCTASILNLCMISVDRYWAITRPLDYGVKRTPARMISCVALVWISSACISLPPLLVLGNEHGPVSAISNNSHHQLIEDGPLSNAAAGQDLQCQVCQEFGYQIYATLGSFYIPLAVMAAVYYQIFQAAKRIVDEEKKAQSHLLMTRTNNSCAKIQFGDEEKNKLNTMDAVQSSAPVHPYQSNNLMMCNNAALVVVRRHSDQQLQPSTRRPSGDSPATDASALTSNETWKKESGHPNSWIDNSSKPQDRTNNPTSLTLNIPLYSTAIKRNQDQQKAASKQSGSNQLTHRRASRVRLRFALNKERKASTTLGIIMSAFTLCWFPFFVLALVRPFMSHQTASLVIPHWLSSLFLWLGYANSFLNPVIYATTNKDFRLPFREILCLRCKSLNSVMREDFYQSQYGNNHHQQLMDTTANNNKAGQTCSPSSSSSISHPNKGTAGGRCRPCSTESVGVLDHRQTATAPDEDDATDYGSMAAAGHRESSSSATAFL